jgi:hypothetical protein
MSDAQIVSAGESLSSMNRPLAADSAANVSKARSGISWAALESVDLGDGKALRQAIDARTPVIVTDLARDWPALERWSPERLAQRYGEREVRVYDASFGAPGRHYMGSIDSMRFADFLHETQTRGRDLRMFLYNLSRQIPELLDDVKLPRSACVFHGVSCSASLAARAARRPLHYDIDMGDVLHTVIRGQRRIRLFSPEDATGPVSSPLYRAQLRGSGRPRLPAFSGTCKSQGI